MVQRIRDITDIEWHRSNQPLHEKDLILQKNFPFKLPSKFIELLKLSNGGSIDYDFSYYDIYFKEIIETAIGGIYGINSSDSEDIVKEYLHPPEFFPQNLVAFAEDGGGNFVCFDYRTAPETNNPPIVHWNHEADEGQDASYVANNFDEFIGILSEPEPYPGDEEQGNE